MTEMLLMLDTMPTPQKGAKSSLQFRAAARRKRYLTKSFSGFYADSDGTGLKERSSTKKVRLVRMDPDATDSSTDEEQQKIFRKRVLAEIIMPTECFMLSDSDSDSEEGLFLKYVRMGSFPKSRRKKRGVSARLKMVSLHALTSCKSNRVALKPWYTNVLDPFLDQDHERVAIDDENMNGKSACSVRHQEKCPASSQRTVGLEVHANSEACDALSESSIASTGHKSYSLCFKVDRIINSPSSVLENMVSENCEYPLGAQPDKVRKEDFLRNECTIMDADEVYKRDVTSEARLMCSSAEESLVISAKNVNSERSYLEHANGILAARTVSEHDGMTINQSGKSMFLPTLQQPLPLVSPTLFEDDMPHFDIEHIFDIESLSDMQQGCMESPDHFLDGGELNFDLDHEALAWINIPCTCGH